MHAFQCIILLYIDNAIHERLDKTKCNCFIEKLVLIHIIFSEFEIEQEMHSLLRYEFSAVVKMCSN